MSKKILPKEAYEAWLKTYKRHHQWGRRGAKLTEQDISTFYQTLACEMCGKKFNPIGTRNMDHDQTNGSYRGALCSCCNTGLGLLGDNIKLAIEKLKKYRKTIRERNKQRKKGR